MLIIIVWRLSPLLYLPLRVDRHIIKKIWFYTYIQYIKYARVHPGVYIPLKNMVVLPGRKILWRSNIVSVCDRLLELHPARE